MPEQLIWQLLKTIRNLMRRPALLVGVIGLRCLPPRYRTGHLVLLLLQFGWDNPWAASTEFLKAMIVSVKSTSGTILECGSGLTTLILCRLVDAKERKVIALEHDADWYSHITNRLTRFSTGGVNVCMVPMREYGTFHWYDISGIHIPENIDLVICDGPPGSTLGGRYGLLPILQSNLRPKCTILLDDAERGSERNVLREWDQKYKFRSKSKQGKRRSPSSLSTVKRRVQTYRGVILTRGARKQHAFEYHLHFLRKHSFVQCG